MTKDKDFGIDGFIVKTKIVKSRTNTAGQECQLVYNQRYGFDRSLSNYLFLKQNDLIRGSGAWFHLDGVPECKFQQKKFLYELETNLKLRHHFRNLVTELGSAYITGEKFDGNETVIQNEDDMSSAFFSSLSMEDFDDSLII